MTRSTVSPKLRESPGPCSTPGVPSPPRDPVRQDRAITDGQAALISVGYQLLLVAAILGGAWLAAPPGRFVPWANRMVVMWDAQHYLTIAHEGYVSSGPHATLIAFFPLYPVLIAALTPALGILRAALLITLVASVAGHTLLFRYLRLLGFDARRTLRVAALVFATPISVYFAAAYTEALYFLITVAFVVFLRREAWGPAALCGFLAALTRNMGALFVIPYLAACWSVGPRATFWRRASLSLVIGAGTLVYLGLNLVVQGSPFAFAGHMAENWYKSSVNPFSMYANEFAALVSGNFRPDPHYELLYLDRIGTLLFPLLIARELLASRRRGKSGDGPLPPGFLLWAVAQYLVVCSQSFWVSNMRYLCVILPAYLMLERALRSRAAFGAWLAVSGAGALWAIHNYVRMHWVF